MHFDDLPRGLPGSRSDTGGAPRSLWMNPQTIADSDFWTYATDKIFLGQTENGKRVGFKDNRHLLTVAGSRAGKGQSAILPNLALYEGSVMVIDPKGENATLSAERRGHGRAIPAGGLGQDVYVLDPFRVADVPDEYRAGFNPIADLDPNDPGFIDDCDSIADALVVASNEATANDHWNTSSRLVLRGVIAWIAAAPNIASRDLGELRRLLHLPPVDSNGNSFDDLLADMIEAPDVAHGIPADAASAIMGMASEERGSVLSTVRQNILFLSSPPMGEMLAGTDRAPSLADWKMGGITIYLCLPATRLHRHSRFFRLFINRLLAAVESKQETPETPALMILDEMHVLGHMAALETAAGLVAGYGVRIWSIWQDFAQLKSLYNARWETFLGNASLLQAFGLNDLTTLKYISDHLGTSSTLQISQGEISMEAAASGHTGQSRSIQASPLLSPDEVARYFSRQTGNQLVLYTGASPMFLKREHFYDDAFKDFRGA